MRTRHICCVLTLFQPADTAAARLVPADTELETTPVRSEDVDTLALSHHVTTPGVCALCVALPPYTSSHFPGHHYSIHNCSFLLLYSNIYLPLIQCPPLFQFSPPSLIHHYITGSFLLQLMLQRKY